MKKHIIINIIITLSLLFFSWLLGWWATKGTEDIIAKISVNIIAILLPLVVLHTTLTLNLLNEIRNYLNKNNDADFSLVIKSIKNNFIEEVVIIVFAIIILIGNDYCSSINITEEQVSTVKIWIANHAQIIANSFVIFAIFYFMWIIVDTVGGLLELYTENNKKTNNE